MTILENGEYRDATLEELEAFEEDAARAAAAERHRPLAAEEVTRMLLAQQINSLPLDDATALRSREFYPEWAPGTEYPAEYKVQYGGRLCRCRQKHTSQPGWEPENAPSLWEYINEAHDGSKYDPIPYDGNMELSEGLYYSQNGILYRCTQSTGQPVYNALAELVGLYVEVVP